MSIIRDEDFIPRRSKGFSEMPASMQQGCIEAGLAEMYSISDSIHLQDDCFVCGKKLKTPYVYWHGMTRGLSLHPECVPKLAAGICRDAGEIYGELPGPATAEGAAWLLSKYPDDPKE